MTTSAERRRERILASPQFCDGRFHNTSGVGTELQGNALPIWRDFLFGGRKRRPRITIPVDDPRAVWTTPVESGLRITWLGHSSLLIEIDGVRALVDPVFGPRASPFSFAGPKRFHRAPVTVPQLPSLDVVLISHDHHDHLDPPTIRALVERRVPFVTSLGVGAWLERFGADPRLVTELDWWEEHALGGGLTLTAAPAQHFSGRAFHRPNTTLWSSFVMTTARRRIFYTGDTGLTDELREIGRRFAPFDVSLIEIGAWHPAWGAIHLGPEGALRAHEMLGGLERAGAFLPVHWATFDLGLHPWDAPIESLMARADPARVRILTPRVGQPIEPSRVSDLAAWWRAGTRVRGERAARV